MESAEIIKSAAMGVTLNPNRAAMPAIPRMMPILCVRIVLINIIIAAKESAARISHGDVKKEAKKSCEPETVIKIRKILKETAATRLNLERINENKFGGRLEQLMLVSNKILNCRVILLLLSTLLR